MSDGDKVANTCLDEKILQRKKRYNLDFWPDAGQKGQKRENVYSGQVCAVTLILTLSKSPHLLKCERDKAMER